MEKFRLHFFKEQTRQIDLKATIAFFESIDGFTIESDDKGLRFIYVDPMLKYEARFLIMQKSQVRDIYRLNPKYLDIIEMINKQNLPIYEIKEKCLKKVN